MKDVSVIIPAYNEEKSVAQAIACVCDSIRDHVDDYEIIVVDDGSQDATLTTARQAAVNNPKIKVLHKENGGFGSAFRYGLAHATKTYIGVFPGDNDMSAGVLVRLLERIENKDLIISYLVNRGQRSALRRFLSNLFVVLMNTLFRLRLKYFNGSFMAARARVQAVELRSNGLTVIAELIVKLTRSGCAYEEVGFEHTGRRGDRSKALSLKSVLATAAFFGWMLRDIYFTSGKSLGVQT